MRQETWKQIVGEESIMPEVDTGEYSLDEILLQFRADYSEVEFEEKVPGESEIEQTDEYWLEEPEMLTEDEESEEPAKELIRDDEPESEPELEPVEVSLPVKTRNRRRRNLEVPKGLKDTVSKLWKRARPSVDPAEEIQNESVEPELPKWDDDLRTDTENSDLTDEAGKRFEEQFAEVNLNQILHPENIETEDHFEAIPTEDSAAPQEEPLMESTDLPADDSIPQQEVYPEKPAVELEEFALQSQPLSSGRKQRVWEEFPDSSKENSEPVPDTIDYSALFKMFAEKPEEDSGSTGKDEPETGVTATENPLFPDLEWDIPEEVPDQAEERKAEESNEDIRTPLFAESTADNMDFRDILRDFMMGDQHPIYADMPGIGKKAVPAEAAEEVHPDFSAEIEEEPKQRRRDYHVEEEFPLDLSNLMKPAEPAEGEEKQDSAAEESSQEQASETQPEKEPKPAKSEGGLLGLLRGFGPRPGGNAKKALNEPKAYVSFEDYIPTDAEATAESSAPSAKSPAEAEAPVVSEKTENPEDQETVETPTAEEDEEILYSGDFPSFGQWILNELMTVWIRLNGIGDRESTATMEDDSEDLGKEVNVANASRYYGSQVTMLRMRFQIGLAVLAILAYITLGFPVSGMLKTAKVAAAMCLAAQMTVMLLCLDVVTNAAINLTRRKFGADSLAVLACVISSLDALAVAVGGFGTPHIPLCLFSSLALMGVLLSALLSSRALRKSTRVPAIGKRVYCVTAEEGVRGGGDMTLLKSVRPTAGFVRRAEEAPPDETLFARFAGVELLAAFILSLLTALVRHSFSDLLYILSAILCCAVPVTALLAFALPYFIGSQRIFSSGAAVAGWSGIHDIGCSRNLIVTDRDLFPEDTISIETVRIFADDSAERIIGYAGTMIAASGSGLGACFAELMEKNNCRMRNVEDFRWLAGGGLQGRIEGHNVLCGSSDLMQLMNVKIPYRLVDRTTVLLAIDGVLYGIFKINYTGLPEIRSALQELIASNRHPIFAIRDFNVTPDMLHEVFDVATDGYDFPPYGDRFRISEAKPSETSKVSAVVCREGLGPLTHLADTGRSMYVAIRINLLVTALIAVLGMLLVFARLIGTGMLNAWLPFVLMLLDAIIVTLISLFMRF